MPKIIFTSRYIKGGTHSGNLINYMATRDGVTMPYVVNGDRPATENQRKLIASVMQALPETAELFEYEDYTAAPTIENASSFITTAFEQNPELWGDVRNYVEYIARRPGAERSALAGHGLWNDGDEPIALSKAVQEVTSHKGNIWTHVVSLRREDAERMGYTGTEPWRNLVIEQLSTVAEAMKIPMDKLRWYAAYHDKDSNPHIHLLVYSADPTKGYLTEPGIEKMRSAFAHGIFKDELMFIYERKDLVRSQLNEFAEQRLTELAGAITSDTPELSQALVSLGEQLVVSKGKKQYGYLKPALKSQVDEIVKMLAADPHIAEMYEHWCELTADVKRVYKGTVEAPPTLEHEKTFKTIKNMVVRQALAVSEAPTAIVVPAEIEPVEPDIPEAEPQDEEAIDPPDIEPADADEGSAVRFRGSAVSTLWSPEYKEARQYLYGQGVEKDYEMAYSLLQSEAGEGNPLALHDLGYMHRCGLGVDESTDEAQAWYAKAYHAFLSAEAQANEKSAVYLQYRIGKLHRDGYGTAQDHTAAAAWFSKAAEANHQYAQYSLASLYRRGEGVEQSDGEAFQLFTLSANQGNAYAAYALAQMHERGIATEPSVEAAQRHYKTAFHGFCRMESGADDVLQYRLGKMLLDGKGTAPNVEQAAEYFRKAAENKNAHAQYQLAKLMLADKIIGEKSDAIAWLTVAAEGGHEYAQYSLGKTYLTDEHKNMAEAVHWFTASAEQGNQFAQYALGKLYLEDEYKNVSQAMHWLTASAEQGNQFAQYRLGMVFLKGEDVPKDAAQAIHRLEQAARQNNQYAQYQLGKLYFKGEDVPQDRDRAMAYFTAAAAQGNEYAQWFLDHANDITAMHGRNLLRHLARLIQQDYEHQRQRYEMAVDRKLLTKIRRKKQELGQKIE